MEGFGSRFRDVRERILKVSQAELARLLGISNRQTIYDVEMGRQKTLKECQIDILLEKSGVSKAWLLLGEGSMFGISESQKPLETLKTSGDLIPIPFLADTYAGAGGGAINYEAETSYIMLSKEFLVGYLGITKYHNLHVVTAIGDSMEPKIHSGELLFILPPENDNNAIVTGAIYAINFRGSVFVKRVESNPKTRSLKLLSDNSKYAPITFEGDEAEDCRIVGRVVGQFNKT
jgi:SOS-response transcriptional repressor LexA